ncbi:hypothetical protein GOODEAATRI_030771 [Goodea atripinnis]|uniref:Secreted protein n=1 Tax=Goodea atripinnis TaxID=208336 RepID=A0ABV0MNC3_9TELE
MVPLFLSVPTFLCLVLKCFFLSALSPSLCLCLPLRSRICGNVLICAALVQSCQSAMSRYTNLTPGNYRPFFTLHREGVTLLMSAAMKAATVTYQLQLPWFQQTPVAENNSEAKH